jgi:hypothetical protein
MAFSTSHLSNKDLSMPLFLDSHVLPDGVTYTPQELEEMHARDVRVQGKYGVRYLKWWYDPARGRVFCLVLAPDRDAAVAVHRESNGAQADDIFEVQEGPNSRPGEEITAADTQVGG